jgi:hypothetical protein
MDEKQRAMKWALVKFVVALEMRQAEDKQNACEANGWRMSSAHDLYDDVIDTVSRLATGSLDAEGYMEEERRKMLEGTSADSA